MAHKIQNGKYHVDSDFVRALGGVKRVRVKSLGGGHFYAMTPEGSVDFDPDRGRVFPGSKGTVYLLHSTYDDPIKWIIEKVDGQEKDPASEGNRGWFSSLRWATADADVYRTLTAADRSALIRLAWTMPVGSPERRVLIELSR